LFWKFQLVFLVTIVFYFLFIVFMVIFKNKKSIFGRKKKNLEKNDILRKKHFSVCFLREQLFGVFLKVVQRISSICLWRVNYFFLFFFKSKIYGYTFLFWNFFISGIWKISQTHIFFFNLRRVLISIRRFCISWIF
jgi:hypothetical protein